MGSRKTTGEHGADPATMTLRLTPSAAEALAALEAATGGVIARHRLAVVAVERGARALAASPADLFTANAPPPPAGGAAAPASARPATPRPSSPPAPPAAPPERREPTARGPSPTREAAEARARAAVREASGRGVGLRRMAEAAGRKGGGGRELLAHLRDGKPVSSRVHLSELDHIAATAEAL